MKKLIMLKGLPASGKSTWAKEKAKDKTYKRINKDDLRAMIDNSEWSRSNEKKIIEIRNLMVENFLKDGFNVIVDDTNFNPIHEETLKKIAQTHNTDFQVKFFDVDLQEAIKRDLKRPNSVGEKVIKDMYHKYFQPSYQIQQDPNNWAAFIFDIDGTLANMGSRHPYDWDKVGEDKVNEDVWRVLQELALTYKIIIMTGRDGVCEEETKAWLAKKQIPYDAFYMREAGNTEKDAVIKKRFLEDAIKDYNIVGVFDDRDQVVDMWRSLGLTCFQVNYGNF